MDCAQKIALFVLDAIALAVLLYWPALCYLTGFEVNFRTTLGWILFSIGLTIFFVWREVR